MPIIPNFWRKVYMYNVAYKRSLTEPGQQAGLCWVLVAVIVRPNLNVYSHPGLTFTEFVFTLWNVATSLTPLHYLKQSQALLISYSKQVKRKLAVYCSLITATIVYISTRPGCDDDKFRVCKCIFGREEILLEVRVGLILITDWALRSLFMSLYQIVFFFIISISDLLILHSLNSAEKQSTLLPWM